MPRKRLTELCVSKLAPPKDGQIDYYDTYLPGLVLTVNYGGRKTWRALHYRKAVAKTGKRKGQQVTVPMFHTLGLYPQLNAKAATDKAKAFLADPQKALAQADTGSFAEVTETFIKRHVDAAKGRSVPLRSKPEIERILNTYIMPAWQHRPFREIKRSEVTALLDKVEDDHGARQADLCLAIIRKMMNWYATRNDEYVPPVVKGMGRYTPADHKRERTLAGFDKDRKDHDPELRALWAACADMDTFGALVKVLLLTAQRRDKVVTMKWDDVNLIDGTWTVDTEAREKANARVLRLPQAVLDIIAAQPRIAGNPYVFAAKRGPGPFNSFSQRKEDLDEKLPKMPHWTLHDLRHTAKTLMARAGVRPDISERVLGHAIEGVEGIYDQHDYTLEKADALVKLAALVDTIINPPEGTNVVQVQFERRGEAAATAAP